jgi:hypothetical protein
MLGIRINKKTTSLSRLSTCSHPEGGPNQWVKAECISWYGFLMTRIPVDVTFQKGNIEYRAVYQQVKNTVFVIRGLVVKRSGAVCKPEEL